MSTVAFLQNISVNCRHCIYECIENTSIPLSHLAGLILTRPIPFLASYSPSNQKKSPWKMKNHIHIMFTFILFLLPSKQGSSSSPWQSKIMNTNKHHLVDLSPCTENTLNSVSRMGNLWIHSFDKFPLLINMIGWDRIPPPFPFLKALENHIESNSRRIWNAPGDKSEPTAGGGEDPPVTESWGQVAHSGHHPVLQLQHWLSTLRAHLWKTRADCFVVRSHPQILEENQVVLRWVGNESCNGCDLGRVHNVDEHIS